MVEPSESLLEWGERTEAEVAEQILNRYLNELPSDPQKEKIVTHILGLMCRNRPLLSTEMLQRINAKMPEWRELYQGTELSRSMYSHSVKTLSLELTQRQGEQTTK